MGGKEKSGYQWWQQRGMKDKLPEAKGALHGCPPFHEFKTDCVINTGYRGSGPNSTTGGHRHRGVGAGTRWGRGKRKGRSGGERGSYAFPHEGNEEDVQYGILEERSLRESD